MPIELTDILPAELSRVRRAATGRDALLLKTEDVDMPELEMLKNLGELMEVEIDGEDEIAETLKEQGVDDTQARNAAVAAARLIDHFSDELGEETRKSLAQQIFEAEIEADADNDDGGSDDDGLEKALDELPPELRKAIEAEREEAQKAMEELRKEREKRERAEAVEKANEEMAELPTSAEDLGDVLYTAKNALDEEQYEQLTQALKAASEQIEENDALLKEYGAAGSINTGTDAWAEIQRRARELVEDGEVDTVQKGVKKVIERDKDLAKRHQAENR